MNVLLLESLYAICLEFGKNERFKLPKLDLTKLVLYGQNYLSVASWKRISGLDIGGI